MENMGTASADISTVTQIASNDSEIEMVEVISIEAQSPPSEAEPGVPVGSEISYDDLVNDIRVRLGDLTHPPSSGCCIYRVPENIRKLDEDAYTPQEVSIGPYHHGSKKFLLMENCKWTYFQAFIQRSEESGVSLNRYVKSMKDSEGRVRASYADTIEMTSDEVVKMMLVDACFILEFLGCCNRVYPEVNTFINRERWRGTCLYYDLILLENQIPFFILESIYHLAVPTPDSNHQLHDYILRWFGYYNNQNKSPDDIDFGKVMHFTDLIREFYLPLSRGPPANNDSQIKFVYTATQLQEAGVKFKESSSKCLLDVKFTRGVLEFPRLTLRDETKYIFRNLMALEVCHYSPDTPIIDYVFFLDRIIDTPNDVDLLVKKGMLYSRMGSTSAVADIVNNLCKEITYYSRYSYLFPLCKELNAYYNLPKNRLRAALKRDYFNTPWRTVATIGAIILLLLTLIQSICSVISVV